MSKNTFASYLTERLGVTEATSVRLINALREFLLLELDRYGKVSFKAFGVFEMTKGLRRRITFKPSPSLYSYLNDTSKPLDLTPGKLDQAKINQVNRRHQRALTELDLKVTPANAYEPNLLKYSFLKYLLQDFPLDIPWVHPITKTHYEASVIRRAVEIYHELDPDGYLVLWCLWMSLQCRQELANRLRITPHGLQLRWNKASDSLLFIVLNPQLEPSKLHLILNYDKRSNVDSRRNNE